MSAQCPKYQPGDMVSLCAGDMDNSAVIQLGPLMGSELCTISYENPSRNSPGVVSAGTVALILGCPSLIDDYPNRPAYAVLANGIIGWIFEDEIMA